MYISSCYSHLHWGIYSHLIHKAKSPTLSIVVNSHSVLAVVHSLSCWTFWHSMDWSTPGFPVLHCLLEIAQTHVHWVNDAIQPSHRLLSPSPLALNLSQHQGLFEWVCSSYQIAEVLEFQLQHQSSPWIFGVDFLWDWLVWSPCSPGKSQEPSHAPQFESLNSLALSLLSSA